MIDSSRTFLVTLLVLITGVCCRAQAQQPAVSPADAAEQKQMQAMQAIEDRWSDAIVKHDQYGLENTLSPQLVDISAQGEITTRNQQVARLFVKDVNVLEMSQKVVNERVFGETAIVSGTYTIRKKDAAGTATEKGVFTHIFGRTRAGWLCLQSQRTAVVEQQVSRSKSTKKSSAPEPFHIPLFHKGAESAAPPAAVPSGTDSSNPPK